MHTHIQVQFLGAVTKTQPYMIVTEYMPGGSLTDIFRASKKMTLWRGVQVGVTDILLKYCGILLKFCGILLKF